MMRFAKYIVATLIIAASCGNALAQAVAKPPNLFWATPSSGTGFLSLRAIAPSDLSGVGLNFSIIGGTLLCSQMPALTGAITTTGGTCATNITTPITVPNGGSGTTTFTANLPILGNGSSQMIPGAKSGNTNTFATTNGVLVSGHCVQLDSNLNFVDSGNACGVGGGGSGTVTSSAINDLAYYAAAGTTVTGLATANNGILKTDGSGVPSIASTLPCLNHPALSGDATTPANSCSVTLGTVNSNIGAFGSTTAIPTITVNGKGLVTAVTTNAVIAPAGTLTGTALPAGVTGSSLTSVGTLVAGATGAGFTINFGASTESGTLGVANGGTGLATLTANAPLIGNGAGNVSFGTRSGNTTVFATTTGTLTSGDLAVFDANGNISDGGATCPALGDTTAATNPTAGNVGEVLSYSSSATAISNASNVNAASGSITAGHWLCWAHVQTNPAGGAISADVAVSVSTVSASFNNSQAAEQASNSKANYPVRMTSGPVRYNATSTATLYAVVYAEYSAGTLTVDGNLMCERIW